MSRTASNWTRIIALAMFAALALPVQLAAQDKQNHHHEYHHYQLIDVGTLGGPNSGLSGPDQQTLDNGERSRHTRIHRLANPIPACPIAVDASRDHVPDLNWQGANPQSQRSISEKPEKFLLFGESQLHIVGFVRFSITTKIPAMFKT
jgi:hypothetical protein